MKKLLAIGALGAACASCLVVPALIAAGGAGLAGGALGFSLAGIEMAAVAGLCALLLVALALVLARRRAAPTAARHVGCAADGSCGCGVVAKDGA